MAIGTEDKSPRGGLYSGANASIASAFNTPPSARAQGTAAAMNQKLLNMAPPMGLPQVPFSQSPRVSAPTSMPTGPSPSPTPAPQMTSAPMPSAPTAPSAPAAPVGPISQMRTQGGPMSIAAQAGQLPARVSPEPPVDPKIIQRFARLQEPNMGIKLTGPNLATPGREFAVQPAPIQTPVSGPKNPLAGMTVSDTRVPGVRRVDGGSSPLFTNIDPAKAVQEMQGGTVNSVPAAAFKGMGGAGGVGGGSSQSSAALQAAAGRGDWDAIQKYYQSNGGTWLGKTEKQSQGQDLMRTAQRVLEQQMNSEKGQPVDVIKQMAELQNGASGEATAAAQLEGQGIQNDQARMMLDLTQKAIAGDPKALAQLQGLQGKEAKNPTAALLQELMKAWAEGSASGMGGGAPLDQMLREAWPMLQMAATGQMPATGPAAPPPPNETRGNYKGVPGVVRNGQFIPD